MQSQAEVVSNSRNKVHQTWRPPFNRTLYLSVINKGIPLPVSEDEQTDIKGESATKATTSRPPPRGEPPRRRRPSEAASSRWRPSRPDFVSSYDPFNQHIAPEAAAGPFGSRPYFSQRAEDEPRSNSFYFPL